MLGLLGGIEAVLPLTARELLRAIHVAQIVDRVGDDGDVDPADLGGFQRFLDRGRHAAAGRCADIAMKARAGERRHVLGRQHMHVEVDDHGDLSRRGSGWLTVIEIRARFHQIHARERCSSGRLC
jgi:hypothetical protein